MTHKKSSIYGSSKYDFQNSNQGLLQLEIECQHILKIMHSLRDKIHTEKMIYESAFRERTELCMSFFDLRKKFIFVTFFSVFYQIGDDVPDPLGILSVLSCAMCCHLVVCRTYSSQGNERWSGSGIQSSELFQSFSCKINRVNKSLNS